MMGGRGEGGGGRGEEGRPQKNQMGKQGSAEERAVIYQSGGKEEVDFCTRRTCCPYLPSDALNDLITF